ncbi:gamma carbonic anhydrase family protein [Pseudonocardia dioxanivorans]|jgi:carbonic anhydrase/acetyltransferase-like protein (isoleucine patch superfamily)|uniref:gamma carbonic anhydrase family protein n=1 Tax=Pseudonocardia dioxanivorans TaxID=240495 RepID=UPI000CD2A7C5|nr:gamma carbonic anhydrase family protein [Pseudonocardia dioxanivorans]
MTTLLSLGGATPEIDPTAWVAPGAVVAGRVRVGAESGIWYTCVVRADLESITIGRGTNLQDGAVAHSDPGFPLIIGDRVSIGHRAVLHGCVVEDEVLIGMGAIVLNGARIGAGALVAAGAVVPQNAVVPPNSLVAGIPAKVRRELDEAARAANVANARDYRELRELHRRAEQIG